MSITTVSIFDRVIDFMYNDVQPDAQNYINLLVSIYYSQGVQYDVADQGTGFLNQIAARYPQDCLLEIANGQFQNNDTMNLVREISQYLLNVLGPSVDEIIEQQQQQQRPLYNNNNNMRSYGGYPDNNTPISARELAGRNLSNNNNSRWGVGSRSGNLHPNANTWGSTNRGRVMDRPSQIRGNYDVDVSNVFNNTSRDYRNTHQEEVKMPIAINNRQQELAERLREIDKGGVTDKSERSKVEVKSEPNKDLPFVTDIDSALNTATKKYEDSKINDIDDIKGVPENIDLIDFKLPQLKPMSDEDYVEYTTHELNTDEKARYDGLTETLESCKLSIEVLKKQIEDGEVDINNPSIKLSSEDMILYPVMLKIPSMQSISGTNQYTVNQAMLGKVIIHMYHVTGDVQGTYLTDTGIIARLKDLKEGTLTPYKLNTLITQIRKTSQNDVNGILSNLTDCIGKWVDEAIKFKIGANNAVKIDKFTLTDDFEIDLKIYLIKNGYASEQLDICEYLVDTIDSLRYYLPFIKSGKELTTDQPSAIDYIIDESHLGNIYYTLTPVVDVIVPFNLNALKVKFKTKLVKESYRADVADNKILFDFYDSVLKVIKESPNFNYTGNVTLICRDTSGNKIEIKKCYPQSANVIISKV